MNGKLLGGLKKLHASLLVAVVASCATPRGLLPNEFINAELVREDQKEVVEVLALVQFDMIEYVLNHEPPKPATFFLIPPEGYTNAYRNVKTGRFKLEIGQQNLGTKMVGKKPWLTEVLIDSRTGKRACEISAKVIHGSEKRCEVEASYVITSLGAGGFSYVLEKSESGWKIVSKRLVWMS